MSAQGFGGVDVIGRLERLEQANRALGRECRMWRRGAGGLAVAVTMLGLIGAGQAVKAPRTIEAQNFVLRDEAGRVRASLGFRSDGTPGFALMDELARVRLALDLCADGAPAVNLYDTDGGLQAAVAVRPDGSPGLGFFQDQGKLRLSLDLGPNSTAPGLSLYDRSGTMRAAMAVRPDETPGLGLFDPQGKVVLSLDAEQAGKPPVPATASPARVDSQSRPR
jgi:hypothetical protein